jgi:hypothetical protein
MCISGLSRVSPARAQNVQFLPEVDAHLRLNSSFRAYLEAKDDRDGGDPHQFAIGPSIQLYLKPLINLKHTTTFDLDDTRSRFLVLETGYRYITAPGAALWSSWATTLSRDIVWDRNPIHAGAVVQGELHAFEVAPGYQSRLSI